MNVNDKEALAYILAMQDKPLTKPQVMALCSALEIKYPPRPPVETIHELVCEALGETA
jgi:hypothetical protein